MRLIIGLGNPGEEYKNTRHNVGFEILDRLQANWEFPAFEKNEKFKSEISKKEDVLLAKPQTFMNLSGEAVQSLLAFYKLTPENIIVIHDDLDIGIGRYKITGDSSSAGHNGVQDIIDKLGTQKFKRVRIGIGEEKEGAPVCRVGAHDFVLAKFSEDEVGKIAAIEPSLLEEIKKLS